MPEEAGDAPSEGGPVKSLRATTPPATATPESQSDYVEFGVGKDPASDSLEIVGVSKTFDQGTDLWLRVKL